MNETLFDEFVDDYEEACARGLALSGEQRDFFAQQRVRLTRRIAGAHVVRRVVDFGCGLGHTVPYLLEAFPDATILGIDAARAAIESAKARYGGTRASFATDVCEGDIGSVDLVYTNGTFHHIDLNQRSAVIGRIFRWLGPGGRLALWENNPWNPGTRLVMSRIEFDRDAQPLSYLEAQRLVRGSGLDVKSVSFHFYFPSVLRSFRRFETALERVPFGAQYCVNAAKSSVP